LVKVPQPVHTATGLGGELSMLRKDSPRSTGKSLKTKRPALSNLKISEALYGVSLDNEVERMHHISSLRDGDMGHGRGGLGTRPVLLARPTNVG
jgi:hypothetical protein